MIIESKMMPKGPWRPGLSLKEPRSITIHWIGPYPNQDVYTPMNWWMTGPDKKGMEASAHFIVKDKRTLNCLPIEEVAWHCGCKEGNYSSIGIEVIPMNTAGEFSFDTICTLARLLETLPKVPLKRHYDWTKKDCPRFYTPLVEDGQSRWEELVNLIRPH